MKTADELYRISTNFAENGVGKVCDGIEEALIKGSEKAAQEGRTSCQYILPDFDPVILPFIKERCIDVLQKFEKAGYCAAFDSQKPRYGSEKRYVVTISWDGTVKHPQEHGVYTHRIYASKITEKENEKKQ